MRRLLLAGALLGSVIGAGVSTVGAQVTAPTVSIASGEVELGESLRIEGADWPPGVLVSAIICGNGALDGSVDCDLIRSSTNAVASDGSLRLEVEIAEPPQPCPCLLRVSDAGNQLVVDVPLEIAGVDVAEPESRFSPRGLAALEVVDVDVRGSGPVASWFGAAPRRDLVVTLRNAGDEAVTGVSLLASWSGGDGTTQVTEPVDVPTVGAGAVMEVSVGLRFDLLANGTYQAGGELISGGDSIAFATVTQMRPWGLFGLAIAAAVMVPLWLVWRLLMRLLRRRRAKAAVKAEADSVEELGDALLAELDAEILARLGSVAIDGSDDAVARIVATEVEAAVTAVAHKFELSPEAACALAERVAGELASELEYS
jgi:hypothetical protein